METNAPEKSRAELICQIDDVLTYAAVHNGIQIVRSVGVRSLSEADMEDVVLKIDSDNGVIEHYEVGIQKLKAGEEVCVKDIHVNVNADYLSSLTERSMCRLTVSACLGEEVLASEVRYITALAFDQWPGLQYSPELLAAFVTPNHLVVSSLLQLSAKYLEQWTGDPSLAGYQFKNPNRVKKMAAAAYAAIQQRNITYAEPPSSFEEFGQRIRLADAVMDQHMGTCMDLTLLYAACLEAMGLNPVMVMMRGHIFAGVWLIEESFPDMVMDDPSQLEKRMSKGIHELVVVECTAVCAGRDRSFDEAVAQAERNVGNYNNFAFVIDVRRARSMGIRPLPARVKTDSGFQVVHEERQEKEVTQAPAEVGETFDLSQLADREKATKQTQWERKLLDLSLRNMLINMRLTKAVVPLLSSDVSVLEDALADGEEFQILPRPADMKISGEDGVPVEMLSDLGPFSDFIALEGKHRRLHSFYTEKELGSCLMKMYRSAKTSLEENGASTLYLAVGLLRWFESEKSSAARYAPIVLIPVEIHRKSAAKGYALYMRDEDAQINITLLEFLKQNFDIQIYGLNPPPADDHGLDIPKIFAIIRRAVMNLPMWDVVEAGFVGNFSFSQFVMWNDIHNQSDFLEKNKIVRSLIKGAVDWDCAVPQSVDAEEALLPVTVDASQLRAINMAAGGVSFVLHGPPGTGKSQTITAMIANALAKEKTVLFVAEKMAALEVVKKRLASLGIENFCLELHSNKATKKMVLDQLKQSLEMDARASWMNYGQKIQDIRNMRAELDGYSKALHAGRPFGKSLRQLIDVYELIPDVGGEIHFSSQYAGNLRECDLDAQTQLLEQLVAAGKAVGHPHGSPLNAVHRREYDQRIKFDLEPLLAAYRSALEALAENGRNYAERMQMALPVSGEDWEALCAGASCMAAMEEIPAFLRSADAVDREFEYPKSCLRQRALARKKKEDLLRLWNENFLRMDMEYFGGKFDQANKKFFGKGRALSALTAELQAYASFPVETEKIPAYLTEVTFCQQEIKAAESLEEGLSADWKKITARCATLEDLENYEREIAFQLQSLKPFAAQIRKLEREGTLSSVVQLSDEVLAGWKTVRKYEQDVAKFLDLRFRQGEKAWIDERLEMCAVILENAALLKDWIMYRQLEGRCRECGLGPVCDAYEAGMAHEDVMNAYLRSIYRAIIRTVIEREPVLNSFTGTSFNEKIAQFKKMDQEFMELTREEIFCRLTSRLPSAGDSTEVSRELNILRRAISSNGRGISIRSLFEQIPTVLKRLSPCMLMSPISVAQYLAAKNDLFDIVIFDEASQLPTCKAVGVLARGKNAVIVGDPNQMPPTSFFAGNAVDEDNLDLEDLDSILDDCLALGMPQTHLHWHYRSRHESLIAFSNREFYENSMLTFPSVNDREKKVRLVKTDGFFERGKGRVNEGEARAIVREIKKRYEDPERRSQTIGVVTFNLSQQTLIEDLLQEEYQKDAEFDRWANAGEESLFVKNLENVQGDERDAILFSVTYGPDAEGKLSLNFGPLNKSGGWKRLNVAVSRARSEMVVFTSMTADRIDLRRTKSKGVEALKDFLEFAEKGRLQEGPRDEFYQKNQGILEHICRRIEEEGFRCQTGVGHSKFKIDIAVLNPYCEEEYLLGIMLDGSSYAQSENTRDREVAQPGVLKGLGWKLHRVWTMDWWDNRDRELEKIVQILRQEREAAREKAELASLESAAIPEEATETPESAAIPAEESAGAEISAIPAEATETPKIPESPAKTEKIAAIQPEEQPPSREPAEIRAYEITDYVAAQFEVTPMASSEYVLRENLEQIAERLQAIVDAEAPIAGDRLIKKALRAFRIARSSPATLEATEKALKKIRAKVNKQAGVKFYWGKEQDPEEYSLYRRDAGADDRRLPEEICQQELKNALCAALNEKGPLEKELLVRETVRAMGYARSGQALSAALERGLKYGRKTGEIVLNEDGQFCLGKAGGVH